MYRVILFDFFGVIRSDQYESWLQRHGYERKGAFAEISKSADKGRTPMRQFFDEVSKESHIAASDIQHEFKKYATIDSDVVKLIEALKKHYLIGLLSNSNGRYLRVILNELGLKPLFDEIIISGEVGYIKPSKEIFEYALRQVKAQPQETIFIDDNRINVDAAKEIGIKGLWFRDAAALKNELRKLGIAV